MWNSEATMSTQQYPVDSESSIDIESTACDITIAGVDQAQVVIKTQDMEECRVVRQENRLQITANPLRCDNLVVAVPAGCTLRVSSVSGELQVAPLAGDVTLKTMSGDVSVHEITGHLHLHTVSGDVAISHSAIPDLTIETVSGDISLDTELAPDGNYNLHTISGDILVTLDETQRCIVRYQSLSGDFSCNLPHELRRQGWGKVEAVINGGGVAIQCNSTSGDLAIRPARKTSQEPGSAQQAVRTNDTRPLSDPFALDKNQATQPASPAVPRTRMEVLKAIEEGTINVTEGLARLQNLDK
jgi:DUF4097 and DUF4098 domain-containing protein YvlB